MTSAQANKMLRELNSELSILKKRERDASTFLASVGEDVESCRPYYDFKVAQEDIEHVESKIRKLKHKINVFNTTYVLDGFDMTIDQALVYLPQLTQKKQKLQEMISRMGKERVSTYASSSIIDYRYINYDLVEVGEYLQKTVKLLNDIQDKLDTVNNTVEM